MCLVLFLFLFLFCFVFVSCLLLKCFSFTLSEYVNGEPALDWPRRKRIALGASRGLLYLHEQCDPKIIHRDIKASNILLDDYLEAIVADFG